MVSMKNKKINLSIIIKYSYYLELCLLLEQIFPLIIDAILEGL